MTLFKTQAEMEQEAREAWHSGDLKLLGFIDPKKQNQLIEALPEDFTTGERARLFNRLRDDINALEGTGQEKLQILEQAVTDFGKQIEQQFEVQGNQPLSQFPGASPDTPQGAVEGSWLTSEILIIGGLAMMLVIILVVFAMSN